MKISIEYNDDSIQSLLGELVEKLEEADRLKLIVGTNVSYAYEHQVGDGQRKREFLGVSDTDRAILVAILQESIADPNASYHSTLQEMGEYMLYATDQRWEQEVDPSGMPWAKNAPWVIERKKKLGRIQKILQDTGRLRSSIAYRIE